MKIRLIILLQRIGREQMNELVTMPKIQIGANKETAEFLKQQVLEIENERLNGLRKALVIGAVLYQVQQSCEQGEFVKWLDDYNVSTGISRRSAYNYIGLTKEQKLIENVESVNEALKIVEKKNRQEKIKKLDRQAERVKEYKETGKKPDDWKRGTDDKAANLQQLQTCSKWQALYTAELEGDNKAVIHFAHHLNRQKTDTERFAELKVMALACKRMEAELKG